MGPVNCAVCSRGRRDDPRSPTVSRIRGVTVCHAVPWGRPHRLSGAVEPVCLPGWASIGGGASGTGPTFVGIEVAKGPSTSPCDGPAKTWSAPNDALGIDALVLRLGALAPTLIVLEATGGPRGHSSRLASGRPPGGGRKINPRHIRAFAQAEMGASGQNRPDCRAYHCALWRPSSRPPGPYRMPTPKSCGPGWCGGASSSRW